MLSLQLITTYAKERVRYFAASFRQKSMKNCALHLTLVNRTCRRARTSGTLNSYQRDRNCCRSAIPLGSQGLG